MSGREAATPAVLVDGVTKHFVVPQERRHTLEERALHPLKRSGVLRFEALTDVTLRR